MHGQFLYQLYGYFPEGLEKLICMWKHEVKKYLIQEIRKEIIANDIHIHNGHGHALLDTQREVMQILIQ